MELISRQNISWKMDVNGLQQWQQSQRPPDGTHGDSPVSRRHFQEIALFLLQLVWTNAPSLAKSLKSTKKLSKKNFSKVIDKGNVALINVGNNVSDHFPDVKKMVGTVFLLFCSFCLELLLL